MNMHNGYYNNVLPCREWYPNLLNCLFEPQWEWVLNLSLIRGAVCAQSVRSPCAVRTQSVRSPYAVRAQCVRSPCAVLRSSCAVCTQSVRSVCTVGI